MMETTDDHPGPLERATPLPPAAVGAIIAFVRVAELYDPAVAHRSALRALVADRLVATLADKQLDIGNDATPLSSHRSVVVAAAAIRDLDATVNRPGNTAQSLLSSSLIDRIPGLDAVDTALKLRHERFDGAGQPNGLAGTQIPLASRICAVADQLVGNPTAGFVPPWKDAIERVANADPGMLDPTLISALKNVQLDDIAPPLTASVTIQDVFDAIADSGAAQERGAPQDHDAPADEIVFSTQAIRDAVSNAAKPEEIIGLLAHRAQRLVDATEVVVLTSTTTQLSEAPIARVHSGEQPVLSLDRLDDIFEFSTQAELRAGITLERSLSAANKPSNCAPSSIDEIITPIMVSSQAWGLLVATRTPGSPSFSPEDRKMLATIATEIADIVAATAHWADMEKMALGDQLTGIGNRHRLYRVLDSVFGRPPTTRADTALIMCDVDGLKVVNDSLGHHEGDRLLIDAAAALTGAVRNPETTTVCRIGGDEFCMVIDGGALLTAHEIAQTIERLFERSAGSGPPRSISCGIAFADASVNSRSELLRTADENQYQTKRARKESQRKELLANGRPQPQDRRALRD